jgi:uncharacterized membrane protein YhaH (DUF805 family)
VASFARRFFPVGRCTRGRLIGVLFLISIAKFLVDLGSRGRIELTFNLGFSFDALSNPASYPLWRVFVEVVVGLIIAYMVVGRLHDISRPGWWLAVIIALPFIGEAIGLPEIAFLSLIIWLALLFWSPTIGPNIYGPDPRGWKSREHYDTQLAELNRPQGTNDQTAAR